MTACRSVADVEAQADRDSAGEAPLSQEAADRVAAILMAADPSEKYREVARVPGELASTTP